MLYQPSSLRRGRGAAPLEVCLAVIVVTNERTHREGGESQRGGNLLASKAKKLGYQL